jgi:enoyl-CoA hydratase/carnithine racemase
MGSQIRIDVTRPLATVLLDPPEGQAALDAGGWRALAEALRSLSARRDVAAVVLRGTTGTRMGRDDGAPGSAEVAPPEIDDALAALRACRHPTVALIEGPCAGAGLELAACCDLRVCGESSRFGAPIARGDSSESSTDLGPLDHLLGASPSLERLRGGDWLDAERARDFGLVSHVTPDTAVVEHAYGLAARVAAGAPLVNRWHKRVVQRLLDRES